MALEKVEHLSSLDEPFVFIETMHTEHYHEELEIARIKEAGKVTINHIEYDVDENDLLIINPNIVHSIQTPFKALAINLDALGLRVMDSVTKKYIAPIYERELVFPPIIRNYNILNIVTQLFLTLESKDELYEFEMKELSYLLFHDLFKHGLLSEEKSTNILTFDKISSAIEYIEYHYNEEITIEKLATICNLSSSHFMKVFKEKTNQSCNEYLIEYRLGQAAKLLELSDHPVSSIVYEVGFRNVSNFNRLFKKHYSLTPEKYRKAKRK